MVVEVPPRSLLVQRRLAVRNFWRGAEDREKRKAALQSGFAKALGTSTTAITVFELDDRNDFPSGKGVYDYIRTLEALEREVEREKARRAKRKAS